MNANFLPLLIGSLPLIALEKAIEAVFSYCPNSPSWPQLPKLSIYESMNLQYLEGIPGWELTDGGVNFKESNQIIDEVSEVLNKAINGEVSFFAITEKHAKCFYPFLNMLKNKSISLIKGQVIGPITFLTSHKIKDYGMLIKDNGYKELIPRILGLKAKFQIEKFKEYNGDCNKVIFFDEPILSQIGSAVSSINREEAKELIKTTIAEVDCYKGLHICGNSDWDFILKLPIDIINFDTFNFGEHFLLYRKSIEEYIARGGYIALGMIPTDSENLRKVEEHFIYNKTVNYLNKLKEIIGLEKLRERIFITPSCGMGALTEEEAYRALQLLSKTVAKLSN